MKKFVLIALCVLMLIGTVSAENYGITWEGGGATCGAALTWSVEGSTLYITGTGEMYDFPTGAPGAFFQTGCRRKYTASPVGADRIRPNVTGLSRSLNGSSFPTQTVGAARSRPKLTQLSSSLNVERLRRSGRLRASPTRRMRSSGCFLKSGAAGGCYPPLLLRRQCRPVGC